MITEAQEIAHLFDNERWKDDIAACLMMVESDEERGSLEQWIEDKKNDFLATLEHLDDPVEVPRLCMWFWTQLKSEWCLLNSRNNYELMATGMPDMALIAKSSIASTTLVVVEEALSYVHLKRAEDFLNDPIPDKEKSDLFKIDGESLSQLKEKYETNFYTQKRVLADIQTKFLEAANQTGGSKSIRDNFTDVALVVREFSASGEEVRGLINNLGFVAPDILQKPLEQFVESRSNSLGVRCQFRFSSYEVKLNHTLADNILDPLFQLLETILRFAQNGGDSENFLRVEFKRRGYNTQMWVHCSGLAREKFPELDAELKGCRLQFEDLGGTLFQSHSTTGELGYLLEVVSDYYEYDKALFFTIEGSEFGLSLANVVEIAPYDPGKVQSSMGEKVYDYRDKLLRFARVSGIVPALPKSVDKQQVSPVVIVCQSEGRHFAVYAERLGGIEGVIPQKVSNLPDSKQKEASDEHAFALTQKNQMAIILNPESLAERTPPSEEPPTAQKISA